MPKFKVWVEEIYHQEIHIEADSVEEAIKLVREGNGEETTQLIFQHSNDVVQVDDEHVYTAGEE